MPKLTPVFAFATLVAAIVSVYFWQQLQAERATTAQLRERVAQLETMQSRPALAGSMSLQPAQSGPQPAGPGRVAPAVPTNAAQQARAAATQNLVSILNSGELMKDPDYREGIAISMRASIAQNYAGLARELDLTPEQLGKLYDLLTKSQMATMSELPSANADEATARESANARMDIDRKQEADAAALLGDTKYRQFKDYQQSLPVRMQVTQLSAALEASGMPLAEPQQKQLIAALAADQKQRTDEAMQAARTAASAPRDQTAMLEDMVHTAEQNNSRMVDVASPYLNAQQLDAFRKMQNQSLGMTRAMVRAQRAQLDAQGQQGNVVGAGTAVVIPAH